MAIVNIAVYIMTRMKYEQQMSMMELIVLVIDTGKQLTKRKNVPALYRKNWKRS